VHPDEQIELLKHADKKRKAKKDAEGTLEVDVAPEREWVLPTRLSEKWTLRRLSEVFDGLSLVPPEPQKEGTDGERSANPWRTTKRVVLATADADSTVVYYILHDGVVKPRQN
jgi:tRNA-splicing endonuclease subunit Sen15